MTKRTRFSIKWKIFLTIGFLITAALLVVLVRTSQIFREDKENFVKELSSKLTSSAAKNVTNLISTFQDKLIIFISSKESLSHTGAKSEDQVRVLFSRYQEFISIGFIKQKNDGTLSPDWFLRNPQSVATSWPLDFEKNLILQADAKRVSKNGRVLWRMAAPDRSSILTLAFSVEIPDAKTGKTAKAWIVGILPPNTFNDLLMDFSTGLNTAFIVDDQGIALGHSSTDGRLKNLRAHPVVIDALKNDRPSGAGDFLDLDGRQIIGSFELIPKMNLAAVVTTPSDKAFEAAEIMSRNIIFIGFIILIVALTTAILLANYMTAPLQRLAYLTSQIGAGNFEVKVDVKTNDEIGDLAQSFTKMGQGLIERDEALAAAQSALVQSEKMGAFGQISAGIAHEVKNPLAGILGHAQLAMGKAQNDEMRKHLEVIEKETRRCKAIVENLMKFARQEKADMTPTDLGQVVQDTINLVDHQLSLAGCKIYKDIKACPLVPANSNQLQQVLLNLMVNSSHAMEACETKNVTVRVVQVGNKAQIQIEDTGTGIPPEVQKRMFEPFFTTKPAGKGTGLGLSVSIGIVKDHKGEIYLKSELGKGTTFFIDIPIPEDAKMPTRAASNNGASVAQIPAIPNAAPEILGAIAVLPSIPAALKLPSDEPSFPHDMNAIKTVASGDAAVPETTSNSFRVKINRPKLKG
jgi:two-component system NtrC family sensor kinase